MIDVPNKPDPQSPRPGQTQIAVRLDDRNARTSYANGFSTSATPDELVLDFGLNQSAPTAPQGPPQITFAVTDRIIMNYYLAKRLAIQLGQIVRRHEEQFGELELDVNKRRRSTPPSGA